MAVVTMVAVMHDGKGRTGNTGKSDQKKGGGKQLFHIIRNLARR
jgi:hypothetical protein